MAYDRITIMIFLDNSLSMAKIWISGPCSVFIHLFFWNLEKSVGQNQIVDAVHFWVSFKLRINVEEHLQNQVMNHTISLRTPTRKMKFINLQACRSAPQEGDVALRSKSIVFYWSRLQPVTKFECKRKVSIFLVILMSSIQKRTFVYILTASKV